jgi:hypothetical protein
MKLVSAAGVLAILAGLAMVFKHPGRRAMLARRVAARRDDQRGAGDPAVGAGTNCG